MWRELWGMMRIDWKGKIGYGDIVSPICYAYSMAQKNCQDVELMFHWPNKKNALYKEGDAESIDERARYLSMLAAPINYHRVKINHKFESKIDYNHTNYDDSSEFHNFWYARPRNMEINNNYIALNTTAKHQQQLEEYGGEGKTWKDPVGLPRWKSLEDQIINKWGMEIVHVGYDQPIKEVIDIYKKCTLAIGYHGSTMWVAKYMRCPMVIYSDSSITKKSFPWAITKKHLEVKDLISNNPLDLRNESLNRLGELNDQFKQYLNIPNIHRLRGKRT
jgi:hypothetical protein